LRAETLERATQAAYDKAKLTCASANVRQAIHLLRQARMEGKDSANIRSLQLSAGSEDVKRLNELGYALTIESSHADFGVDYARRIAFKTRPIMNGVLQCMKDG
jgi:hypothetical protein